MKKIVLSVVLATIGVILLSGCTPSIPMAPGKQDLAAKQFAKPEKNKARIYVYRNSFVGSALVQSVYLDNSAFGSIANKTYLYKEVTPGQHQLTTTSEFSPNSIFFQLDGGKNYYFNHYIKMGVFVGGANIEQVSEEEGKKNILECNLAI